MMLIGYRTYIIGALLGVVAAGEYLGYIPAEVAKTVKDVLIGGGLMALRAAVK